ncbi:MAG: DUF3427 domain-containing protein [Actinobacteria bacterium]|uniref:Unannotated protein n=1 Tax=freshwater metagenome TaxID=449393 RepID=A0A6J6VVT6_9ZZZZ|nr:DUF3427 domain-containing protein [Actinomycetota bacterium]MTB05638.1 DUF3427 domain-containing protein [Actinomycetota bacterium]
MGNDAAIAIGLYDLLLTSGVAQQLIQIDPALVTRQKLHPEEAAERVALHLYRQVESVLSRVESGQRLEAGRRIVELVLEQLERLKAGTDLRAEVIAGQGELLRAISRYLPDGSPQPIAEPLIPLVDTTLLTNAPGEPAVGTQINAEMDSADEISVLMAFIRRSGVNPMIKALRRHCSSGRRLRILTTTYTNSTEQSALDLLADAGAEIKVSYDLSKNRLHAKAWIFRRNSGFGTAYIGSSNLTSSAQVSGLEWNVRASAARNRDLVDKMRAVFEAYWESPDFRPYDPEEFARETAKLVDPPSIFVLSPISVSPHPFQARLLEQIEVSRRLGHHRNLLVSATGTGKTVMAALDYRSLQAQFGTARLLFLAHRREILEQSHNTFKQVLLDANFGEQWFGGKRPQHFDHVFASIQSLNRSDLDHLDPRHFDVVIIDEFHHAAAGSYERILDQLRPKELLGLTATPERSDGLPILDWFDGRIAAELRLWDAIEQQHLSPFQYFGIHDGLDLSAVPWKRGHGYDVEGLTNVYTVSDLWAHRVLKELAARCADISKIRALGFCVSVEHARFMERVFVEAGVHARAVWADTPVVEREQALKDLKSGAINVLFSVDLFNEGVDVPSVDTVLFLRPTDSPTLFLQQLGRGLRRSPGKDVCTVLDFVGTHRKEFRFDRRFGALLGGTRKDLIGQIEKQFPYLPAGCYMELDEKSAEIIISNIKSAIPSTKSARITALRAMVGAGHALSLAAFLEHSGISLEDLYAGDFGWSDLMEAAGVPTEPAGPHEKTLRRAVGRLLHVDDEERLEGYRDLLASASSPVVANLAQRQYRLAAMLVAPLVDGIPADALPKESSLQDACDLLWRHTQVRAEAIELLEVLSTRVDHLHSDLGNRPENPLQVHARYTRAEILAAFQELQGPRAKEWREGVKWFKEESADAFVFTLDKGTGAFSPTTRYRDYALSPELIHWESQSTTPEDSVTGMRYRTHEKNEHDIFLFARVSQNDRAFWFLGPATYVDHEGSRPMAIKWRLKYRLPGDLYASFAAAVA